VHRVVCISRLAKYNITQHNGRICPDYKGAAAARRCPGFGLCQAQHHGLGRFAVEPLLVNVSASRTE
jgi:hypothetical protein